MLFDTDVLIWVLRRHPGAIRILDAHPIRMMSAVTWMELVQGIRNAKELRELHSFSKAAGFQVIPINENTSHRGTLLLETYAPTHGLHLTDALIAACSIELGEPLLTADLRHFSRIRELNLVAFKP